MKIAICGLGRAGKELLRTVCDEEDISVVCAFCRMNSDKAGLDIGTIARLNPMGVYAACVSEAEDILGVEKPDVVIDFSNPAATKMLLMACKKHCIPAVVCTTGFSEDEIAWMKECVYGEDFGIVYAPNVTVGINVLLSMLKAATRGLPYYDYQITEIHHNKKVDAPSGTAKKIAAMLEQELHLEPDEKVPVNSVRAGGYVGVHEIMIVGEHDRITISHESFSRAAFAKGALEAARFVATHTGWHEMEDVVSCREHVIKMKV
jgi:4-hydroxy-tetrahydrodipicolinate reductase